MKIALAQINTTVGAIAQNVQKIIQTILATDADVVVFPELAITGYCPRDMILQERFVQKNLEALESIALHAISKTVIIGHIDADNSNRWNSASVLAHQKIIATHRKIYLPNYAVFDEKRWFTAGTHATIAEIFGKKAGILICEDAWHAPPAARQKKNGAQFLIVIAASPYSTTKIAAIESVLYARHRETGLPIVYTNLAGGNDGIVYYGHSMLIADGRTQAVAKDFAEDIVIINL